MVKKNMQVVMKTMMAEVLATAGLLLLLALLTLKMEWGKEQISIGIKVLYGMACFLGGVISGKAVSSKRYLSGLGSGALYFLIWWLMSMAAGGGAVKTPTQLAAILGICCGMGMAGGMISAIFASN